ncbi:hypothetical protein [Clostridium sp. Marseille-Q2269]|uniref:hypothetical protein n=1 Tax=Clostridium sp. Marseille-Q2269 TaxID=2942205 RepID=UPI002072F2D9|nr:hypothetical protein [Clostridium sp. Marseille-Q2269]
MDVMIGGTIVDNERIEQAVINIINTLAYNELNYDSSNYVLNLVKDKLGEKCFIKA